MEQNCMHVEICPTVVSSTNTPNKETINYTFKPVKMDAKAKEGCHIVPMCVDAPHKFQNVTK